MQADQNYNSIVIAGGVAANQYICKQMLLLCQEYNKRLIVPPISLCTDNAAMIAWCGIERFACWREESNFAPRSRWSICS